MEENPPEEKREIPCSDNWVLYKSKSRKNQTYYFNTLTGESVWNLSEVNKGKAISQSSQECPKPSEPLVRPSTSQTTHTQPAATIVANPGAVYKDRVIDYQLVQPPPILVSAYGVPQLNNFNNFTGDGLAPFKNIVWDRPPPNYPYPILPIPPAPLPENSTNKHDIIVQNTAIPLSQRFKKMEEQSKEPIVKRIQENKVVSTLYKPMVKSRFNKNIGLDDLRLKLRAKRNMQQVPRSRNHYRKDLNEIKIEKSMHRLSVTDIEKEPKVFGNFTISNPVNQNGIDPLTIEMEKESTSNDDDIAWLADNMYTEDNRSQIDVSPLRNMAPYSANADCWYILADTNVYISNLEFLNILIHSDNRCCLLVSQTVLNELATAPKGASKKLVDVIDQARTFVHTLLASGHAKTDKDVMASIAPGNVGCPLGDDQIVKCCLKLVESNYHVILLSNDKLLERKASATSIPIFTVDKMKNLLASYGKEKDAKDSSRKILITINNKDGCDDIQDDINEDEIQDGVNFEAETGNIEDGDTEFTEPYKTYDDDEENFQQQTAGNDLPSMAHENGLGLHSQVTTYLPTSPELPSEERNMENFLSHKFSDAASNNGFSETESSTSGNKTAKPRIIRLKRKTELQKSPRSENMKKPAVKWRRRPLTKVTNTTPDKMTQNKTADTPAKLSPKTMHVTQEPNIKVCQQIEPTTEKNDDVASSVVTSCSSKRNSKEHSKLIEETSTSSSDVIPNSRSSINSDKPALNLSNYSIRRRAPVNNVPPEPMDNIMVDNLRSGCEEWVSRFVQIMEEGLTQVLLHMKMPVETGTFLPLNLYEATDRVKRRFLSQIGVSQAANKFMNHLLEFKDSRGCVRHDLNPEDYMKMFGCGEKLVQSLEKELLDCEDINTSLDSLAHLLNDIKVPKSFNESIDNKFECTASTEDHFEKSCPTATQTNSQQVQRSLEPHSPEDYYQTSKDCQGTETVQQIKFVRIAPEGMKLLNDLKNRKAQSLSQNPYSSVKAKIVEEHGSDDSSKPGPKISFKFNICPQFEERLRASKALDKFQCRSESDIIDEEMDYEGLENFDLNESYDGEELDEFKLAGNFVESREINGREVLQTSCSNEDEEHLATFIKIFMKEIKDTFFYINRFCQDTYSELTLNDISASKRLEIETKAKDAYGFIESLLRSLNSILERESNATGDNIKSLVPDSFCGRKQSTYRDIILKCLDQAKILSEALNSIKTLNT